jgi:hypothetical protein
MICISGLPVFYQLLSLFSFRIFPYSSILLVLTCFQVIFFDVMDADAKSEGGLVSTSVFGTLHRGECCLHGCFRFSWSALFHCICIIV